MAVAFNLIPLDLRTPGTYVEVDNSQAVSSLSVVPTRILVMGQPVAGTAPPLTPQLVSDVAQARTRYGRGAQLTHMIEALRRNNTITEVWAMAVADLPGGTAATGTITFSGTATGSGTLSLYVGGRRVRAGVEAADTAADVATAVAAAVTGDPDLPVTASAAGAILTLTARNKGLAGNDIDLRTAWYDDDALPDGITAVVVGMAGGTGNPDIGAALAAIGDEWFTDIVVPWNDAGNLTALADELADRFGPLRMIDTHAWRAMRGSHGDLVNHGATRNSPHISVQGWAGSPTSPWEVAAALAGRAVGALAIDPARPVQTLVLAGVLPPPISGRFTLAQRNTLLHNGISTLVADAGGSAVVERVVTEYRETPSGAADTSWLNVETVKTVTWLRYDTRTYFQRKYPRHKLADDGTRFGAGQPVMTPKLARAELLARFAQWEEAGLVQDAGAFQRDLITERSATDRDRLNALIPPTVINQLRVFAGLLQFRV